MSDDASTLFDFRCCQAILNLRSASLPRVSKGKDTMPYWRSHHHVVWSTTRRRRVLTGERVDIVAAVIRSKARDLGCLVHAVAVQPDHVHIALSIPPKQAPARVIGQLKGASSRLLRLRDPQLIEDAFFWQAEYGIISFSGRDFDEIIGYIRDQDQRHAEARLNDQLERDMEESLNR